MIFVISKTDVFRLGCHRYETSQLQALALFLDSCAGGKYCPRRQALTPTTLNVGIVNALPKLVALRILTPGFDPGDPVRVAYREGDINQPLGELAVHRLDLLLSDRPIPAGINEKAFNHPLGESGIGFFAHTSIADRFRQGFPNSPDGAPMLLPAAEIPLRRNLEDWFDRTELSPQRLAEFDDSALLKAFGEAALGVYAAPVAIAAEVCSMYHSELLGTEDSLREAYFAISPERKLKHPTVLHIIDRNLAPG